MMFAYDQICAYMAIYIEKVTGAASVDHMIPRSIEWSQVYRVRGEANLVGVPYASCSVHRDGITPPGAITKG